MFFTEKILNHSNSYNFYKKEYEKLIKKTKRLKQLNTQQEQDIIQLKKELHNLYKNKICKKIRNNDFSELSISIKSPEPIDRDNYGEHYFAIALAKQFKLKGFNVRIHNREEWYDYDDEIVLVLRGNTEYKPNEKNINIMWNIVHPEFVSKEEYEKYDIVFISSESYINQLTDLNVILKPLLQCTDPDIFFNEYNPKYADDIVFVGNTRGVYRQIVKDMFEINKKFTIYGLNWDKYPNVFNYVKEDYISNEKLHQVYSSCKILLNDHWEDMRELDFPSNRLFDGLASGAFIISDNIPSAETIFEGTIVTYDNQEDLREKVDYYLSYPDERKALVEKGQEIVLNNHTFYHRVESIIEALDELANL